MSKDGWAIFDSGPSAMHRRLARLIDPKPALAERAPLTADDMLTTFKAMQRQIDDAPPVPHCIRTSHSVPYGRAFRQWDTKGRLIVWANRGELADLPRRKSAPLVARLTAMRPDAFGIPVVHD